MSSQQTSSALRLRSGTSARSSRGLSSRRRRRIGLYSLDFFATQSFDETGLGIPITLEELFWGDAGIGLSIVGTTLAAAAVRANGTDEQLGEWVPAMFGSPGDLKLAAFCSSEPDAGSDVGAMRTRARYHEATGEWVLNGTKTWATNGGLADVHVVTAVVDPELRTLTRRLPCPWSVFAGGQGEAGRAPREGA